MAGLDSRELESRIALLQGQIQKHKEKLSSADLDFKSRRGIQNTYGSSHAYHPYREHKDAFITQTYKNKTLILNNSLTSTNESSGASPAGTATTPTTDQPTNNKQTAPSWIVTPSRNAQIINSTAYDPIAARERVLDPAIRLKQQVQAIRQKLSSGPLKQQLLTVDGVQYSVESGGSKLVRIAAGENAPPTPKQVTISGMTFLRSKNGNLYRSSIINRNSNSLSARAKTELCKRFSNTGTTPRCPSLYPQRKRQLARQDIRTLLTSGTGSCLYGPKCPFIHDPAKIAVCREFLRRGSCSQGQHCDLSHELTYERVPACVHFIRGSCNKDKCPYPHVHINPAASICRVFTSLGYCSKGTECEERHVFECPDYAEGNCDNPSCRLPHVDRAGQLRQQNTTNSTISHTKNQHDQVMPIKSENLAILDSASDIDSEEEVTLDGGDSFSQEHDFLRF